MRWKVNIQCPPSSWMYEADAETSIEAVEAIVERLQAYDPHVQAPLTIQVTPI